MSTTVVTPHSWLTSDYGSYDLLNTGRDAITQLQGGTPIGGQGPLDFAKLRQTSTQTLTTATWTSLTMDAEDKDIASGHTGTSALYTVQTSGEVQVECGVAFAASATGLRGLRILVAGATTAQGRMLIGPAPAGGTEFGFVRTLTVTAGQTIEIQGRQDSGGNLATAYTAGEVGCFLNIRWVHV